jgi:hypothetical protein
MRSHGFDESQDMVTLPQQSIVRRVVARQDKHTCSNLTVNDGELTERQGAGRPMVKNKEHFLPFQECREVWWSTGPGSTQPPTKVNPKLQPRNFFGRALLKHSRYGC